MCSIKERLHIFHPTILIDVKIDLAENGDKKEMMMTNEEEDEGQE